ncbi:major capsid protein [Methyloversatilis thermotolerans]|uniref:major capsid protein n=1 Tax=Methyloversatilis thermotolerans TaxID=1346290 RepID=UPI00035DDF37|nr:major capsid protein [Methyloversatilis thermotolerans]
MKKYLRKVGGVVVSAPLLAVGTAHASGGGGIDVSAVTSAISSAGGPIATIGAAVLVVLVGIKVYKWIARAL